MKLKVIFICCVYTYSIVFMPILVLGSASVSNNWNENFDDKNFNGWTAITGNFTASSNMLIATGEKSVSHRIKYPSTLAYGQWSFDVYVNTSSYSSGEHMYLYFLMEELGSLGEEKGYYLALWVKPPASVLFGKRFGIVSTTLGGKDSAGSSTNYQHIDITRNSDGHFNIFLNNLLIVEALDEEFIESAQFGFDTPGGHGLDNISVSNEVTITPKQTERANLQFSSNLETVSVPKGESQSVTISIENNGHATGYGSLVIGTLPKGITINAIGPDSVKDVRSGESEELTLSIKADTTITAGDYDVDIELHNASQAIDTLTLKITVISSDASSGFLIINLNFILAIILIHRLRNSRKK